MTKKDEQIGSFYAILCFKVDHCKFMLRVFQKYYMHSIISELISLYLVINKNISDIIYRAKNCLESVYDPFY